MHAVSTNQFADTVFCILIIIVGRKYLSGKISSLFANKVFTDTVHDVNVEFCKFEGYITSIELHVPGWSP